MQTRPMNTATNCSRERDRYFYSFHVFSNTIWMMISRTIKKFNETKLICVHYEIFCTTELLHKRACHIVSPSGHPLVWRLLDASVHFERERDFRIDRSKFSLNGTAPLLRTTIKASHICRNTVTGRRVWGLMGMRMLYVGIFVTVDHVVIASSSSHNE